MYSVLTLLTALQISSANQKQLEDPDLNLSPAQNIQQ